jgi:hypothetical protein
MRSTIYSEDGDSLSLVVADGALTDTLESARERTKQPGALCVYEIFDAPDGASEDAITRMAIAREEARETIERNMTVSYYWNASMLPRVNAGGVLMNNLPAPLSAEDCAAVLEQLALHPDYNNQTIIAVAMDFTIVTLANGRLEDQ